MAAGAKRPHLQPGAARRHPLERKGASDLSFISPETGNQHNQRQRGRHA